jgi:hypothetical protein
MIGALLLAITAAQQSDGISDYALVWTSPSADAAGSVPIGNGELGANAWVEPDGDLVLLLARHDTHSEASRLLKPGRVRVSFDPPPAGEFVQKLNLYAGRLEWQWGDLTLEVFAEPDAPRFRIAGRSGTPRTVRARLETWRTAARRLTGEELNSSWTMRGAPEEIEVRESADAVSILDGAAWLLHAGGSSVVPLTLRHQGLESLTELVGDPLDRLVFTVLLHGDGFAAAEPSDLVRAQAQEFELRILAPRPRRVTEPGDAEGSARATLAASRAAPSLAKARAAAAAHWEEFWMRSWIFVRSQPAPRGFLVPTHDEVRLGRDSAGGNLWQGEFERALLYLYAIRPEQLRGRVITPTAHRVREVRNFTSSRHLPAMTAIACLRRPPGGGPARIFDSITAGGSDGFLLDLQPGRTLRLIVGDRTLLAPGAWPDDGAWHTVAAVCDGLRGTMNLWVDGRLVAEDPSSAPALPDPVTQAYVLQRWVTACQGRGAYPIKFNGGLFTVEPRHAGGPEFDADWRRWGDAFWWQNTRLPYHAMLAAGDSALMTPLFDFYERVLPLCRARTRLYYGVEGVIFPETITPFGTCSNGDYGWERAGHEPSEVLCPWWQWEWNQGLELVDLMLLHHAFTGDDGFARARIVPMAREVLKYFDARFPRDADGRLRITPTQALETHWHGVVNDMPCVAGLHAILPRLRALPETWTTPEDRALYDRLLAALPPLPVREQDGARLLAPAQEYDPSRQNVETPELYATFPFRLAALGGDAERLAQARAAFALRHDRQNRGWTQDGIFAARLGLIEEARAQLLARIGNSHPNFRFPATWGPNFDWLPDQCHGANLQILLQEMLLQHDGDRILLFPAWPQDWNVDFRLHAPHGTVIAATLLDGELVNLEVTPPSRAADVVNLLGERDG